MSQPNPSPLQGFRRCIYFPTDGISLINLPLRRDESLSLIDSAGGNIRLMRFSPADADRITAAIESGATFRFVKDTLHIAAPSGRWEFSPRVPDEAAAKTPALPSPRDVQQLHDASARPHVR